MADKKEKQESRSEGWHRVYERAQSLPAGGQLHPFRVLMLDIIKHLHAAVEGSEYEEREQPEPSKVYQNPGGGTVQMFDKAPMIVGGNVAPSVVMTGPAERRPQHVVKNSADVEMVGDSQRLASGDEGRNVSHMDNRMRSTPIPGQPGQTVEVPADAPVSVVTGPDEQAEIARNIGKSEEVAKGNLSEEDKPKRRR